MGIIIHGHNVGMMNTFVYTPGLGKLLACGQPYCLLRPVSAYKLLVSYHSVILRANLNEALRLHQGSQHVC